VQYCWWP